MEALDNPVVDNLIKMTYGTKEDLVLAESMLPILWPQMSILQKQVVVVFAQIQLIYSLGNGYILQYPRFKGGWDDNVPRYTNYDSASQFVSDNIGDKLQIYLNN